MTAEQLKLLLQAQNLCTYGAEKTQNKFCNSAGKKITELFELIVEENMLKQKGGDYGPGKQGNFNPG